MISTSSYKSFKKSKYPSIKYPHYFHIYDHLLSQYKNKKIKFVEIGILDGGSLFLWRDFFGDQAEIIGIELNPEAKKWESHGFKIYIGDQSDEEFWRDFYKKEGPVDIILDDGGHTSKQQLITLSSSIKHIKKGGQIIIEDTHSSYMKDYGNPSRFSFVNFSKKLNDVINMRFFTNEKKYNVFQKHIFSIEFFDSIIAFKINSDLCIKSKLTINNNNSTIQNRNFRYDLSINFYFEKFRFYLKNKSKSSFFYKLFYKLLKRPIRFLIYLILKIQNLKLLFKFNKLLDSAVKK